MDESMISFLIVWSSIHHWSLRQFSHFANCLHCQCQFKHEHFDGENCLKKQFILLMFLMGGLISIDVDKKGSYFIVLQYLQDLCHLGSSGAKGEHNVPLKYIKDCYDFLTVTLSTSFAHCSFVITTINIACSMTMNKSCQISPLKQQFVNCNGVGCLSVT